MKSTLDLLVRRFDGDDVRAMMLAGSFARGDAGPFSDVDLVRFVSEKPASLPEGGSHIIDGRLVVVSDARPAKIETWFTEPEHAVNVIAGLRRGKSLLDRDGTLAAVQARSRDFVWDDAMQRKADNYASEQMVGWIEEVHKALEGLQRNDPGRLLNAAFGLSWGLSRVVQVQRGVLITGDNTFFKEIEAAVGVDTEWSRLRRVAFGVKSYSQEKFSLRERVTAGLRLYILTAEMLAAALIPTAREMVDHTAKRIAEELATS